MRFVENDTTHETPQALHVVSRQSESKAVTIADIWEAHKLLKPRLHHTPLEPSRTLHEITGADIT